MRGAVTVGDAGQDGQQVAQAVAVLAVFAESHPRQVERPAGDGADVVVQHEPLQADGLELLQVFGEVLRHPAAVDP
jgi:hypothetical protein